jgi:hypothetical protein
MAERASSKFHDEHWNVNPAPLWPGEDFHMAALSSWNQHSTSYARRIRICLVRVHEIRRSKSLISAYRGVRCHEFNLAAETDEFGSPEDVFILEKEQFDLVSLMRRNEARTLAA